jgi:hypothetical protein
MYITDNYYPKFSEFVFDIDIDNMCDPSKKVGKNLPEDYEKS